jgi:hypothetical protein
MDVEREIDRRIQLLGIRLGQEPSDMRDRMRQRIELEEANNRRLQLLQQSSSKLGWDQKDFPGKF